MLRVFIANLQLLQDACIEAEQVSVSHDQLIVSGYCSFIVCGMILMYKCSCQGCKL